MTTTVVVINSTYPAVAHFEDTDGTSVVLQTQDVALQILDTGVPGPPGQSKDLLGAFSYGDATPHFLGVLLAGTYAANCRISIETPFDGTGASLSIGSLADHNLLIGSSECYPPATDSYETSRSLVLLTDVDLYLFIQPGSGASTGTGRYWLNLV